MPLPGKIAAPPPGVHGFDANSVLNGRVRFGPGAETRAEHFGQLTDHKVRSHGQNGSRGPSAPE